MTKGFRLCVKNFGKIQAADINVTPMTFFVGDNNSGKSYLMALLYSLLNIRLRESNFNLCKESDEYQWCTAWIKKNFLNDSTAVKVPFSFEVQEHFQRLFNLILMNNREKLAQITFNTEVGIGKIEIEFPKRNDNSISLLKEPKHDDEGQDLIKIIPLVEGEPYIRFNGRKTSTDFFLCRIMEFLIKVDFKIKLNKRVCFLPTSRTGFLLTYKSLLQSTIEDAYDILEVKTPRTELTRPCTDFLKNLATISTEEYSERFSQLIEFMEQNMIGGHVSVSNDLPQALIRYRPSNTEYDLPMHLTSGVVTELTPLILMLEYCSDMGAVFIEEPEMSLHPALQLQMARVLLRLHAKGLAVFVTTHSDTILQHVNNMLKLSVLPFEEQTKIKSELGYTEEDMILEDDIEMYQFDVNQENQRTTVTKLEKGPYGFIVPSFNTALRNLLEISRRMEIDDDI